MKFGEKVRDLRKKNSLTQDELAKCLGVSKRTIIGWERDGRYPRNVEILEKMADIFHVPLTYIQPDQSLFIERAAATYGKKGKIHIVCFEIRGYNTVSIIKECLHNTLSEVTICARNQDFHLISPPKFKSNLPC